MTRFTTLLTVAVLFATFATSAFANNDDEAKARAALEQAETAAVSAAQWEAFSDNLVKALKSEHEGLRLSAMQRVIRYGDQVNVDDAVFDVVRLYRDHDNDQVRRMAVVALGEMQNAWAMDLLTRSERYEKSPAVRHTIQSVLAEYGAASKPVIRVGS